MSGTKSGEAREPLFHLSKRSAISPVRAWAIRLTFVLLGFVACGLLAFLMIEKLQSNPAKIGQFYADFIQGSFGKGKLWKYLKDTAILLCVSLALVPAFRMRFWNIGGEGQTLVGILGAIAVNIYLGGRIPEGLLLVLMFLAALLSGAVWGVIPAIFRARWGTNETLFTLMMNYVATYLVALPRHLGSKRLLFPRKAGNGQASRYRGTVSANHCGSSGADSDPVHLSALYQAWL